MTWDEAVRLLPRNGAMEHGHNDVLTIRLGYDFEPHGRASETWEDVWQIVIPEGESKRVVAKGKTMAEAQAKFIAWMAARQ
jgi:hypothetical protein